MTAHGKWHFHQIFSDIKVSTCFNQRSTSASRLILCSFDIGYRITLTTYISSLLLQYLITEVNKQYAELIYNAILHSVQFFYNCPQTDGLTHLLFTKACGCQVGCGIPFHSGFQFQCLIQTDVLFKWIFCQQYRR